MQSLSEENYLKTIHKLLEKVDVVYTNDIAQRMHTKAASVTDMLRKLSNKKLINYKKYNGVTLTTSGRKIAVNVIRKHRLWEMFLVDKLNFKWDEVHDIAEQLEHIRSEKLINQVEKILNYPKFDPHGDPIPDSTGKIENQKSKNLSEFIKGNTCIMTGVVDHTSAFLQYLDKSGLALGNEIKVQEIIDYDKSFQILINKKKNIYISNEVAKNILVTLK